MHNEFEMSMMRKLKLLLYLCMKQIDGVV